MILLERIEIIFFVCRFTLLRFDLITDLTTDKSILKSKNIKYEFLQSMDWNSHQGNFEMGGVIKDDLDYFKSLILRDVREE